MTNTLKKSLAALLSTVLLISAFSCTTASEDGETTTDASDTTAADSETTAVPEDEDPDVYTVYADPENGSDEADGKAGSPVRTLLRAQELEREYVAKGDKDVTVLLKGGTYFLTDVLTFDGSDGGKNGHRVTWKNAEGEDPIISGGYTFSGWTLHDEENGIWSADVSDYLNSRTNEYRSFDLTVNGKRADLAHYEHASLHNATLTETGFQIALPALRDLSRPQDIIMIFEFAWRIFTVPISDYSMVKKAVAEFTFDEKIYSYLKSIHGEGVKANEFGTLLNAYEFIDEEGEWYMNTDEAKLYYKAREGDDMTNAVGIFGILERLVDFNGTGDTPIENMTVSGITFSDTAWYQPQTDIGLIVNQANLYLTFDENGVTTSNFNYPAVAVYGNHLHNVEFSGNRFVNLGTAGIFLEEGVKDSAIKRNTFEDCAGTAIMLSSFRDEYHHAILRDGSNKDQLWYRITENVSITDNTIHNVCDSYFSGCGILVGFARGIDISYNTLTDLPYTGISMGWGWGYNGTEMLDEFYRDENGLSLFSGNSITHNRIENAMNRLFDGGGIYTLGRNDNTVITDNYISGIVNHYGAIYLDDGTQGINVYNNVLRSNIRNLFYKGDFNGMYDNYCDAAEYEDTGWPTPLDPENPAFRLENNYMEDEAKEAEIIAASGARS